MADETAGTPMDSHERARSIELDQQRLVEVLRCVGVLRAFLSAQIDEKQELCEKHADWLLHPDAEATLRENAERAAASGDKEATENYVDHADLLADYRKRGVSTVFAELCAPASSAPSYAGGTKANQNRLQELLNEFLVADVDKKQRLVEKHADWLLDPDAETLLREHAKRASVNREYRAADYFVDYANLLTHCRALGVFAAFAKVRMRLSAQPCHRQNGRFPNCTLASGQAESHPLRKFKLRHYQEGKGLTAPALIA
jgi:hypothetical protein